MKKLIEAREAKVAEFDTLTVELEGMDEANEEFDGKFKRSAELIAEIKDLNDKVEEAREASEVIKAVKESRNALDVQDDDLGETEAIVEVNEPDMYRDGGEASFIADAYAARTGDYKAQERLGKHQDFEARDVGTGAFTGLVVPQYLVDKFAEKARAGSAFYNAIQKETLPAFGNKIEISRITTGTSAAIQASENSAVSETDMDDTLLTVNVNTIAGQQDVSRQALERGGQPGFSLENVIFGDLVAAYYTELDDQMLNGSGSSGQHLGIASVSGVNETTYTDASPSVAELYPKLADAVQEVNSNRFAPATAIVMHPRRWGMITAGLDSSNRPLVLPAGNNPDNAMGVGEAAKYGNVVGNLLGIPVITDANVVTNAGSGTDEDQIYIVKSDDHILFEDGIFQMKFEETNAGSLTTKLVVYGYSAFASGRQPLGISKISGTGLVTPTF
jgi:HK97 family phage major capsid protein